MYSFWKKFRRALKYIPIFLLTAFLSAPAQAAVLRTAGHLPDLRFHLTDDNGKSVTEQDYRGQTILLYFGFTGCSAQCPLLLKEIADILNKEPVSARLLFLSIDPAHDTPETLHAYLSRFDPRHMTGLTGNWDDIQALTKSMRAAYIPGNPATHGTGLYIFDAAGHAQYLVGPDDAGDLPALLRDLNGLPE